MKKVILLMAAMVLSFATLNSYAARKAAAGRALASIDCESIKSEREAVLCDLYAARERIEASIHDLESAIDAAKYTQSHVSGENSEQCLGPDKSVCACDKRFLACGVTRWNSCTCVVKK